MFKFFEEKISMAFKSFDRGFKEVDEAFKEADKVLKDGGGIAPGTEKETIVEETKPDGTKTVTRTIVRTYGKGT